MRFSIKLANYINKLRNNRTLLNGALFSMFSFINRGFGFLLLLILANYIVPAEYGYLSLFSTVLMVLGFFLAMSTEGYMAISFFKDGESGIRKTVSCIFLICLFVTFVLLLALSIAGNFISTLLDLPCLILYLAVFLSFCTIFNNVYLDLCRLREKVLLYGLFSCSNALLNFLVSILFVKVFLLGWEGRVYAQTLCFFLYGCAGFVFFIKKHLFEIPDVKYLKEMLIWGIPLIPHLATSFIRQGIDRYIINSFHEISAVGLFSFALNLVNIITMVGMGFNQSNSVDIYKVLGDQTRSKEQKLIELKTQRRIIAITYVILSLIIALLAYLLVPYFLPKYVEALPYFIILSIYGLLFCFYLLYTNYLFFYKFTHYIMYITFSSSIIHLVLSLSLTKYNLIYTAWIYVFSQLIILLFIRHYALNIINKKIIEESL